MSSGWNTIESDAGVFTYLVESLGVKDVQFEELLSLDPDSLAQLHPVHGLIFLFRFPTDAPYTTADGPADGVYDHAAADRIFFARQTIQNACATQALLSVLLNRTSGPDPNPTSNSPHSTSDSPAIDVGPHLTDFRDFVMGLPPDMRGDTLSSSDLIRSVHNSFARSNPFSDETQRPADPDDPDLYHFIAYLPIGGVLYELDGLQPAPVSHGPCSTADFPVRVVDVLQRRIARYDPAEIRFNLLAVVRDLRQRARDFGDADALAREHRRRRDWLFENALRRHNFVGFAGEVLRGVVASKLAEDPADHAYDKWVADALQAKKQQERSLRPGKKSGETRR